MKKLLIPLLLVSLLVFVPGCDKAGKGEKPDSPAAPGVTAPSDDSSPAGENGTQTEGIAKLSKEALAERFLTEIFAVENADRYSAIEGDLYKSSESRKKALETYAKQYDVLIAPDYAETFYNSGMPYLFESLGKAKGFTQKAVKVELSADKADPTKYHYTVAVKVKPRSGSEFQTKLEGFTGVDKNDAGGFLISDFTLITPFNLAYAKLGK